jgi:hypothetical protein
MGRQHVELKVTAAVSRHNSEKDEIDDTLWRLLELEIQKLIGQDKYKSIRPEVV